MVSEYVVLKHKHCERTWHGFESVQVHKVVLSAASKTFHDLALEFDMMPHQEHDQLKIIMPSDVSLYAVNMFINFIYTGKCAASSNHCETEELWFINVIINMIYLWFINHVINIL